MPTSNNEWLQYYHQNFFDEQPDNHDPTILSGVISSESLGSPGSPSLTSSQSLQQAFSASAPSKPNRRRSRASKKTPTTLLNANANNFRALVQQFTGCPNPASFANQKGPVNLNFGLKNATPIIEPFRNYDYHQRSQPVLPPNQQQHQHHQQQQQQPPYYQENNYQLGQNQQSYSSFNSMSTSDVFFPSTSMNTSAPSMEISNGFVMEDDLSIDDFTPSPGFICD
ncbi:VQ motif containing protein [Parasponia andersonii]|uniref:VQ motif containing protein n=1 Tax=Parasponia andersonii TaxID=3476 RepID=A0A2P5ABS1_PARAD|nr:VQ motif containing protein [Parasponia andersonii]